MAYQASDAVKKYADLLAQKETEKPGEWGGGTYSTQVNDALQKILNREKFNYDINSDALYKQYAQQYQNNAQRAMADTLGQAAALTGGFGNSYAATAGNQAYQETMKGLNDKIPELYGMALNRYNSEGDALANQFGALSEMSGDEYSKYMDSVNQYNTDLNNSRDAYENERKYDYGVYQDEQADADAKRKEGIETAMNYGNATGDYTGLVNYGYTEDQTLALQKAWISANPGMAKAMGYVKRKSSGGVVVQEKSDVGLDAIEQINQLRNMGYSDGYIASLVNSGKRDGAITEEQATVMQAVLGSANDENAKGSSVSAALAEKLALKRSGK